MKNNSKSIELEPDKDFRKKEKLKTKFVNWIHAQIEGEVNGPSDYKQPDYRAQDSYRDFVNKNIPINSMKSLKMMKAYRKVFNTLCWTWQITALISPVHFYTTPRKNWIIL